MSHPCTSTAASTSAVLSATSSFTLVLLLIKLYLPLAAKPSLRSHLLWSWQEAAISQWPRHQANLLILISTGMVHVMKHISAWNNHTVSAIIFCSFHQLLPCPQWEWGMLASLLLALPWLPCGLLYRGRQITGHSNELGQRWWFEHWFKCSHSGNTMNLICNSQSSSLSFSSPSVIFCFCW